MIFDTTWFSNLETSLTNDVFVENRVFRKRPCSTHLDLAKLRPLRNLSTHELREFAYLALNRSWHALELATLAHDEATIRAKKGGNLETLRHIKALFYETNSLPIPWLQDARKALKEKLDLTRRTGGNASVYFVLVDGFTEVNQYYGCYVGQTMTSNLGTFDDNQSARIANHFIGYRAATSVKTRGIEPLWSLNRYTLNFTDTREEIEHLETSLHRTLEPIVPRVLGDTND